MNGTKRVRTSRSVASGGRFE